MSQPADVEEIAVEIRIGITYSPKEIEIEMDDDAAGDALIEQISASVGEESSMLWLTDKKGRRVGVPTAKLSYVEIGAPRGDRRVGFTPAVSTTSP